MATNGPLDGRKIHQQATTRILPKGFLIVGGEPDGKHAGSVFLQELLQEYPKEKLVRYALVRQDGMPARKDGRWRGFRIRYRYHPTQIPAGTLNNRFTRPWISLLVYVRSRFFRAPALAKEISRTAEREKAGFLWVILNSPFLICVARELQKQGVTPVIATIWDPPERFAVDLCMPRLASAQMLSDFKTVVMNAKRLGTASENMREEYKRRYKRDSVVLIQSPPRKFWRRPLAKPHRRSEFIIGFAGNLYAGREWQALVDALDAMEWRLGRRRVRMRILSGSMLVRSSSPHARIEYLGWRTLEETIHILAGTDIGYLPYWLDGKYKMATTMCFPNKLAVYLAAGIPVFYHGPADGSPARFMKKYPVGIGCDSLEISKIKKVLNRIPPNGALFKTAASAIRRALQEELNQEVIQERLRRLLEMRGSP